MEVREGYYFVLGYMEFVGLPSVCPFTEQVEEQWKEDRQTGSKAI